MFRLSPDQHTLRRYQDNRPDWPLHKLDIVGLAEAPRDHALWVATNGGLFWPPPPAAASTALPGSTLVRSVTGSPATGVAASTGIGRYFVITPVVDAGLNVTLVFRYRDGELNGIAEGQLRLFKSETGAAGPWARVDFATYDAAANTVTRANIVCFSTWTLGNAAAPLPVELTQFTATAEGPAAVRPVWATASERNSQAFEVERSADGRTFGRIGTVAAAGSSAPRSYDFVNTQVPKSPCTTACGRWTWTTWPPSRRCGPCTSPIHPLPTSPSSPTRPTMRCRC